MVPFIDGMIANDLSNIKRKSEKLLWSRFFRTTKILYVVANECFQQSAPVVRTTLI